MLKNQRAKSLLVLGREDEHQANTIPTAAFSSQPPNQHQERSDISAMRCMAADEVNCVPSGLVNCPVS
jgi:hypothetical protein